MDVTAMIAGGWGGAFKDDNKDSVGLFLDFLLGRGGGGGGGGLN